MSTGIRKTFGHLSTACALLWLSGCGSNANQRCITSSTGASYCFETQNSEEVVCLQGSKLLYHPNLGCGMATDSCEADNLLEQGWTALSFDSSDPSAREECLDTCGAEFYCSGL
jgi:hypothetical protein